MRKKLDDALTKVKLGDRQQRIARRRYYIVSAMSQQAIAAQMERPIDQDEIDAFEAGDCAYFAYVIDKFGILPR